MSSKNIRIVWIVIFSIWGGFLSGILSSKFGSPGIIQATKLHRLLGIKRQELDTEERSKERLSIEKTALKSNFEFQAKEIRRVLGYAAKDELIFDFSRNPYLFHEP